MHRALTCTALLALLLAAPFAAAQEATGTITGAVAGEERSWITYADTVGGSLINTASFLGDAYTSITILAQTRPAVLSITEGGFMLSLELFSPPQDCPCTFDDAELVYFTGSSFGQDFYTGDVTVTFDVYERVDEDTFQASGSFGGVLEFRKDFMTPADPEDTLEVGGSFEISRLSREPEGD